MATQLTGQQRIDQYIQRDLQRRSGETPTQIGNLGLSYDPKIASGQIQGLERGEIAYGQGLPETGQNVQDIVKMRRQRLNAEDPQSTRMRESRNRQIRIAKASGASPEEINQITRNAESDIANQEYAQSSQALNDYQRLIGNVLKGQTGLEMGYAGLEKSGEQVAVPQSSGGLLGTVICTELYRQGYMSKDIYIKDAQYGIEVRKNDPFVYDGYIILASPLVSLMKKSPLFTKIISFPALLWANDMAGNKNPIGSLINKYGQKLCRIVGRIYGTIQKANAEA